MLKNTSTRYGLHRSQCYSCFIVCDSCFTQFLSWKYNYSFSSIFVKNNLIFFLLYKPVARFSWLLRPWIQWELKIRWNVGFLSSRFGLVSVCTTAKDASHMSSSPANLVHFQHSHGHLSRSSADSLLHMYGTNFPLYFFKLTPSSFIFSSGMRRDSQLLTPIHLFHIIHDFAALLYSSWDFSFPNWNILAYEVVPHTESALLLDSTSCPSLKIFQFCYMYNLKMRSELCVVFIMWMNHRFIQWSFLIIMFIRAFWLVWAFLVFFRKKASEYSLEIQFLF